MLASGIPSKFQIPWANSAGGAYVRPIPTASQIGIQAGAASLTDGFPPATMTPVASGGVPPFGQDMNGILKQLTQWVQWYQAGGPIGYDGTYSASIGGYPKGTILASATFGYQWLNTVDANTTDPDTGGAGWVSINLVTAATGIYNVKAAPFNAAGNGSTDDTAAIQAACNAAAAAGGLVFVPPGQYLVSATIILTTLMIGTNSNLTNASHPCEIITTTNINGPVIQLASGGIQPGLQHISVRGFNSNAVLGSCVQLAANGCYVSDVTTLNGKYGLEIVANALDHFIEYVRVSNTYKSLIYVNGNGYFKRCSFDMGNSNIGSGSQTTLPLWQANHNYTVPGQAVHVGNGTGSGGLILFLITPGVSGPNPPSTATYSYGSGGNITDGGAVWGVDAPYLNTFSAVYIDTLVSQVFFEQCDMSGDMWNSVYVAGGGTSGLPGDIWLSQCTLNPIYYGMQASSGSSIHIDQCDIRMLVSDGTSACVNLQGTFLGVFTIVNSDLINFPGCYGLLVASLTSVAGSADIKMLGCESMGGGIAVSIGAGVSGFIINGNALGAAAGNFLANVTAIIIGNNCSDFSVSDNICAAAVVTIGTGCSAGFVKDNPGYNPVGRVAISPGASPWTYQAGASPETIYLSSTLLITDVHQSNGVTSGAVLPASAASTPIELSPFDTITTTYTGTLSAGRYIH